MVLGETCRGHDWVSWESAFNQGAIQICSVYMQPEINKGIPASQAVKNG